MSAHFMTTKGYVLEATTEYLQIQSQDQTLTLDLGLVEALAEFFQFVSDENRGVWRHPEEPRYVVYLRAGEQLEILNESSGDTYTIAISDISDETFDTDIWHVVARAYLEDRDDAAETEYEYAISYKLSPEVHGEGAWTFPQIGLTESEVQDLAEVSEVPTRILARPKADWQILMEMDAG